MLFRKKRKQIFRFGRMQAVLEVFILLLVVLIINKRNVVYEETPRKLDLLNGTENSTPAAKKNTDTLYIYQANDDSSENAKTQFTPVLSQMQAGYDLIEAEAFTAETLKNYQKIVLGVTSLDLMGEGILDILDWVKAGGDLLLLYPPESDGMLQLIADKLGISVLGDSNALVEGLHFLKDFMIGGEDKDFIITDSYDSSLSVIVSEDCDVYLESTGEHPVPLIWRRRLGEGTVVVDNLGFMEKGYRGFHCAAYSLLGKGLAYPVINASVFYIDDFPSPVPQGEGKYITADYGMDIKTFYTQIWWEDIQKLAEAYGIRYTGMVIEEYSDQVEAPFEQNGETSRYEYFGNMLLDDGGEIGFHGYNHMPLVLKNFDYLGKYDGYKRWESYEDMKASIKELKEFCASIFPNEQFQVYVPPSNIISEEGRNMLAKEFPEIKAIASIYLPVTGDVTYEQEYKVEENGIVDTPRIISGYVLDDYMQIVALSELTFHFTNSHFQHPDDVLDEDRGAALGWQALYGNIKAYCEWLYTAAPEIRNLTGSEMAAAVQRYDILSVQQEMSEHQIKISLGGFTDEAWLLVRINEGTPGDVTGGILTKQADGLWLLKAEQSEIMIELN